MSDSHDLCPCGSNRKLADCCGRYIQGDDNPATAEELMRSRYSAYVLHNEQYLLATWHPTTRPATLSLASSPDKWLGLKIKNTQQGREADSQGQVEFVARYKVAGRAGRIHENSKFVRETGRWFYLEGNLLE